MKVKLRTNSQSSRVTALERTHLVEPILVMLGKARESSTCKIEWQDLIRLGLQQVRLISNFRGCSLLTATLTSESTMSTNHKAQSTNLHNRCWIPSLFLKHQLNLIYLSNNMSKLYSKTHSSFTISARK